MSIDNTLDNLISHYYNNKPKLLNLQNHQATPTQPLLVANMPVHPKEGP